MTPTEAIVTESVTKGLRDLADFLDAHPDVRLNDPSHMVYVFSRDTLAAIARIGGWRKVYTNDYFNLVRDFDGGVSLQVFTDRASVCERVVVGTKTVPAVPEHQAEIVEWVCEEASLLAGGR